VLEEDSSSAPLIGHQVENLDLPVGTMVALVQRNGKIFRPPDPTLKVQAGDRITVTGEASDMEDVRRLYRASMVAPR
jgi:Trk K+ transport system NAD-binding subunit